MEKQTDNHPLQFYWNMVLQVLIGCDGSNSVIAKSLGLQSPEVYPTVSVRGLTSYSDGHSFGSQFLWLNGDGAILGRVPVDENLVHWFVDPLRPYQGSTYLTQQPCQETSLTKDTYVAILLIARSRGELTS